VHRLSHQLPDDGKDQLHLVVDDVLPAHIHESEAHLLCHIHSVVAVLDLLKDRGGLLVDTVKERQRERADRRAGEKGEGRQGQGEGEQGTVSNSRFLVG
jgi:hypothetical protein